MGKVKGTGKEKNEDNEKETEKQRENEAQKERKSRNQDKTENQPLTDGESENEETEMNEENEKDGENEKDEGNRKKLESRENLENILMRFCRQGKRYTTKTVATHLGVSIEVYRKMEKGDLLITYKQALQLGDLYEVNASWFFKEAIQLDLLLSRMAIIRILKNKNDLLIERLKSVEKSG